MKPLADSFARPSSRARPRPLRPTRWLPLAAAALLGACASGPPYQPPSVAAPASFKEAPAADATWFPAAPADTLERGPWWQLFGDPVLSALCEQVEVSNQNVAAAVANYAQAQAQVRAARARFFPSLNLNAGASRSGGSANPAANGNSHQLGLSASWEPDLWGKLGDTAAGARASLQISAANLAAARLSAQAALATNYVALREADNELVLLRAAVTAYERALTITRNQYQASIVQRTDVLQAQTQLETTRANLIAMGAQRATLEHAIALLSGQAPGVFAIAPAAWKTTVPALPLALPSTLLQRRPDIAAAERNVALANAQIGVQRAAYFPSLSLTASYGGSGATLAGLLGASNNLWSLGLSAAQNLFDAGANAALVDAARATRDAAVANYRQTVLAAFVAVEDQLATARSLAEQEEQRRAASADADHSEQLTLNQYLQGQLPYTSVVTAQVTALGARQTLSQLSANRQAAAIALIQALGGGWHADEADGTGAPR